MVKYTPLPEGVPEGKAEGTLEGEGLCLTVYTELSPKVFIPLCFQVKLVTNLSLDVSIACR